VGHSKARRTGSNGEEAAMRLAVARYELLSAQARDVFLFVRRRDGAILEANRAAELMYGLTRDQLLALTIYELRAPRARQLADRQMDRAAARGVLFETLHQRSDGSTFPVEVSSRGSVDADGEVVLLSVIRDISERKRAQAELDARAEHLRRALAGTVQAMGHLVEVRDPYTGGHERRVAQLACVMAANLGWDETVLEHLRTACQLHDIGKIGVPVELLAKPTRLSDAEFRIIKEHAVAGYEILSSIDFGAPVATMVRQHHERLDGSGYPDGLAGDEILAEARLMAVADVVEAMVTDRPYRAALPVALALDEVGDARRFDAEAAAVCRTLFESEAFAFSE
jgi:PAS domain S-box-containing protein/putative nucleotidyltransferase with HDIG domain